MKNRFRLIGLTIIIGGILMVAATILHPPLVNPYDGETAFHGFSHARLWMLDHLLMLVATFLWLLGLAVSHTFLSGGSRSSRTGSCLFYVSLCLWIVILTAELTALPLLGNEIIRNNNPTLVKVWEASFSTVLLAGYFAVACGWIGVFFYGLGMNRRFSPRFEKVALYSGLIGFIGILITFLSFNFGYIIIPITSGPAFLWTMWLGWKMVKG